MTPTLLVVAKAPVAGFAKTRVAAEVGDTAAAELAAAALLDTLDTVATVATADDLPWVVAMTGDLDAAARSTEIAQALQSAEIVAQRGDGLGERLAHAHRDADRGAGTVQIGMDTPQVSTEDLRSAIEVVAAGGRAFGPASDGGWWLLGLSQSSEADALVEVPMSTDRTGELTVSALGDVTRLSILTDMDSWDDARQLAAAAPSSRLAATVRQVTASREEGR